MKKLLILAIGLQFSIAFCVAQSKEMLKFGKGEKFKKEWEKVDSLEKKGLPKSALEIVEAIYGKAIIDNNAEQLIKTFIYKMKYKNAIVDYAFEEKLKELESEIEKAKIPAKSIMHSMVAEMYWMYYQSNRWKFYNRTATVGVENDDITTWDLNRLANKIIKHHKEALFAKDTLQRIAIENIDELVSKGNVDKELRPTLYDFLAFRALDFFSITELSLTKPAESFEIRDAAFFTDASEFINFKLDSPDSLALDFYAAQTIQELLRFRTTDDNLPALIDAELYRFKFAHKNSVHDLKDSLYLNGLIKLAAKYKSAPYSAEISYLIAQHYNTRSVKYNPLDETTFQFKWDKKKAHDICEEIINTNKYELTAKKCVVLKWELEKPDLKFTVESNILPDQNFCMKINFKNQQNAFIRISTIDKDVYKKITEKYYGKDLISKLLKEGNVVHLKSLPLSDDKDYMEHSLEYIAEKLPIGIYIVMVSDNEKFDVDKKIVSYSSLTVTNLSYIQRRHDDGKFNIQVMHRKNGVPIQGVTVTEWYSEYNYKTQKYETNKGGEFISDKDGSITIPAKKNSYRNFSLTFKFNKDFLSSSDYFYHGYSNPASKKVKRMWLFTDRAIYRPGQTVFFKGILLDTDNETNAIVPGSPVKITFYDVNYQKVKDELLTTNEYGTISGNFQIPTGVLNGQMQISTPYGNKYISVEEYKRPKFEAKMLPNNGNYRIDDEVELKGTAKAYSGANLTDVNVMFRVVRRPVWRGWWRWYYNANDVEILNGTTKTDDKGEFSVKFKAISDPSIKKSNWMTYYYTVQVDVTDINGETQSTSGSVNVGYVALNIDLQLSNEINKETFEDVKIITENLNYEFIPAHGEIKIYQVEDIQEVLQTRPWPRPDINLYNAQEWQQLYPSNVFKEENDIRNMKVGDLVFDSKFDTEKEKKINFKGISKWKEGRYKIMMKSQDAFGNEITNEKFFTLFSEKGKSMPVKTAFWTSVLKNLCEPGEFAKILIGSSSDVKVLYELEVKNKVIKKEWIDLKNEVKKIEIPIIEEYRGNITVHIAFVSENRLYKQDFYISVPYTNKVLDIEYMTFRDKLQPGQKEEWQLKIKGPKGDKVAAEMLAALYDASLDAFRPNYWDFSINKYYYSSLYWNSNTFGIANSSMIYVNNEYFSYPYIAYDRFNWFGFSYYMGRYDYTTYTKSSKRSAKMKDTMAGEAESSVDEEQSKEDAPSPAPLEGKAIAMEGDKNIPDATVALSAGLLPGNGRDNDERAENGLSEVKTRTNFSETAFFIPDLKTNENGEIIVKFTIPESLTRWKFMGLAHTKDLKYGITRNELITQKELMLLPNPPRFFRENDEIEFPVKISNVSDKVLSGKAQIEFFDAITMKPLASIFKNQNEATTFDISIPAGQNTSLKWKLKIPEGVGAITYKVVAKAGNFSDGEENTLPVLTNRMMVTEAFPLPIRGKTSKTFEFTKLKNFKNSNTLRNHKLTLEFTSNPAWYAVQALPYIMEYPYECAEQVFSRFYANSLATHIANSKPKIKKVFDSWKNTPDSKAFLSNLEKNQELKTLLLEETPWVLNSQDEQTRKKQVGLLFDLNKMSHELNSAMTKLIEMQVSNGGWPWFKGMPESRYITQHVVIGMGHLNHLGVKNVLEDKKVWVMVEKALHYLDNEIRKDYEYLKKWYKPKELEENHISYIQIHYLYARSYFHDKLELSSKNKEAFNYFKDQAAKYWLQQSKYMQGLIGLSLYRYGNEKVAQAIVKSLKEFSNTKEELGMYWKDVEAGYNWWQAPIETQAVMIELFDEVGKDQASVNDLKVWLLKQKQTQDWKTTKATVEAIYALLLKGADWLDSDELVKVKLGTIDVDPKKLDGVQVEAGTGYYKASWAGSEIVPEMGDITVTKNDEGVSWGALYWQYFEQLDKITPHETPLKLNKKLFIERNSKSGKIIEPLLENSPLLVGDKIVVRIELKVDRNMEYVHMKDMRASGFEPINVISRYKWQDGLGYYESTKDAATNFFMGYLPKGSYVFEYPLRVTHNGNFSNGITQIQCMYAPEFGAHSEGIRVIVGDK